MRDNEEEFHPIIEYFSPAPGRNILGSGEECPRLRGGVSSAPGRKLFPGAGNVSRESIEFSTGITQKGTHF
ncbi:hypothetical protein DW888_15075 [Bacteroides nordii]|jgi:hypothetical protein|uniref:Uncharacterized protein n=1 Tax=Bacteroides nordii TaxID=291645 RepID=A0A413VJT7_9BACE|nr:hypothetical protein DW888_15075 [Bacteroides nordii]